MEAFTLEVVQALHSRWFIERRAEAANGADEYVRIELEDLLWVQSIGKNDFVRLGLGVPVGSLEGGVEACNLVQFILVKQTLPVFIEGMYLSLFVYAKRLESPAAL